ncbi:MAG: DUF4832 domain-containing protein [Oscillospiraceae bacterium]|nr:DUF4832 domain-containing protein [Oscillospiraceae bacterium]
MVKKLLVITAVFLVICVGLLIGLPMLDGTQSTIMEKMTLVPGMQNLIQSFLYDSSRCYSQLLSDEVFKNPQMGFAPQAKYKSIVADNTLVYIDITWAELEPVEGSYAFETIAKENYIEEYYAQGKQAVLRFICDDPDDTAHRDIPDWLYAKTGDGDAYSTSYGKGYAPNYANKTFIAYHQKAMSALGEFFAQYPDFLCYVQLGSIGHWGEWHVNYSQGITPLPGEAVTTQYVRHYVDAFPYAKLMMRRPFKAVTTYGLGVFNDMVGAREDTEDWLDWIENGAIYDETLTPHTLTAVPEIWNTAPIGGEFTSSISMEKMLTGELSTTIELLQRSHMTFIGPKCPVPEEEEAQYPEGVQAVLKNIGYRVGVSEFTVNQKKKKGSITGEATFTNIGVAPMSYNWPAYIYLLDDEGKVAAKKQLDIDFTKLTQDVSLTVGYALQHELLKQDSFTLAFGIESPITGQPAVYLVMNTPRVGMLSTVQVV